VEEDELAKASVGGGGGWGGQVSTWSHERHPYPDSYVLAFLPQLLVAG